MSLSLDKLSRETLPSALFPQPPVLRFVPEKDKCLCGGRLVVQKTRRKTVLSLTGPFIAHETVRQCRSCRRLAGSDTLLRLVSSHCNVAYDVLVHVGKALFQRHRTSEEVRVELALRNVHISASEVAYLGRKFVMYLAIGHRQATPRIRQAMILSGGYVLHLDAAHEGDAPALMTGMDSLSNIVLANVKVPSENADYIVPFLRKLAADYGTPKACVHDMGLGICKSVAEVFPNIHDFICHFHFLRDIGKDFLEPAYNELRKCLRNHTVSSRLHALVRETQQLLHQSKDENPASLAKAIKADLLLEHAECLPLTSTYLFALWVLHGKHVGDGYGFPFDRPLLEFAERALALERRLPEFLSLLLNDDNRDKHPLLKLTTIIALVAEDPALRQAVEELRWRRQLFDRLREAMRITQLGGGNGLNDDGTAEAMSSIRQSVEQFRREIEEDHKFKTDSLCRKMARQIDKYGSKLFADPIKVETPNGTVTIYPQRTNNIMEQFFRRLRSDHRRKTGNDAMGRVLQTMLADTPLVKNLDNPAYLEILLNGKTNLEELFAEIGTIPPDEASDLQIDTERIFSGFKAVIKLPTLLEQMVRLLKKQSFMEKSN